VKPLRLVFVSRRFWPLLGGAENHLAALLRQFTAAGHQVTVLTTHWDRLWPAEIELYGARIVRLAPQRTRFWAFWPFPRAVQRWLKEHRRQYDLVYVSSLREDAFAVLGLRELGFPVVLRADQAGPTGDMVWQHRERLGLRTKQRCLTADAIVVPCPQLAEELLAAGYPRPKIARIPPGVELPPPRTLAGRNEARVNLAMAVGSTGLFPGSHLTVYTGRLQSARGLPYLIQAWRQLAQRFPAAYLWLIGAGADQATLFTQILHNHLQDRIVVRGPFDHVDEILLAADLYVQPTLNVELPLGLLEAMAQGLPAVVSDHPPMRTAIQEGVSGLLVPPAQPVALTAAVARCLEDPAWAARLGAEGRRVVAEKFSLGKARDQHLALFQSLIERSTPERLL